MLIDAKNKFANKSFNDTIKLDRDIMITEIELQQLAAKYKIKDKELRDLRKKARQRWGLK